MKLLESIKVGNLTFKNRVMFPPLTTGYEERDGSIGTQSFNFYKRLAQGGVGYIVIGDVAPLNTVSPTPKLFHDGQIETFKKLADACHEFDCKLGIQIFHPDYDVPALMEFFQKKDMAGARAKLHYDMLHFIDEVSDEQLEEILVKIGECAKRAEAAGIDVIQVHGDRLVGSLTSSILNHRKDQWGGSLENRVRFALKVVEVIKENAPNACIDYKFPIVTSNPQRGKGGLFIEEALLFAPMLEKVGVDMLHVAQANHTGNMGDTIPAMGCQPYTFFGTYAKQIKEVVAIPVSTVGRIITPLNAETLIATGKADMIGLGRSLLCDPDYVKKLEAGDLDDIRMCISCNKGCTDNIQNRKFLSCVLNAENGYEYDRVIEPTTEKKKVFVIGGGPAGMEAARVAKIRGHEVVLFEKDTKLGGQLNLASVPPRKMEMNRATNYLAQQVKKLGVELHLGEKVCAECILKENPDIVIVAVGASNAIPPIKGHELPHVLDAWKILAHEQICSGNVVVIGGGLVGSETAELLAEQGSHVTIVEMLDEIAKEESTTVKPVLQESFAKYGVTQMPKTTVKEITLTNVEAVNEAEESISLPCDYVVLATGAKPNPFDTTKLKEKGIQVICVGDCNEKVADINNAIEQGYLAANSL